MADREHSAIIDLAAGTFVRFTAGLRNPPGSPIEHSPKPTSTRHRPTTSPITPPPPDSSDTAWGTTLLPTTGTIRFGSHQTAILKSAKITVAIQPNAATVGDSN